MGHELVMSHVNESSHTCMTNVTFVNESCDPYGWVMLDTWTSHVTYERVTLHMNESCHTCMTNVTFVNESCDTYGWVMLDTWTSHVTYERVTLHMNESCPTNEWVMFYAWVTSHTWVSHATHMIMHFTNKWVTSHSWMGRVADACLVSNLSMSRVTHFEEPLNFEGAVNERVPK